MTILVGAQVVQNSRKDKYIQKTMQNPIKLMTMNKIKFWVANQG